MTNAGMPKAAVPKKDKVDCNQLGNCENVIFKNNQTVSNPRNGPHDFDGMIFAME